MSEESTTPDLVERVRGSIEAANRRDFDALLRFYDPDSVWDMSPLGMGTFNGLPAVEAFLHNWLDAYDVYKMAAEEILDLGNGITVAVIIQKGRPVGSSGDVRLRYAAVTVWVEGLAVRVTNYTDLDEARAFAERVGEERG